MSGSASPATVLSAIAHHWLAARSVAPSLGTLTLDPHQVDAAARLLDILDVHGGGVLADETGLGKTYVALAVARHALARAGGRCLVVAPAGLKDMWSGATHRAATPADFVSFEALSRGGAAPAPHHPFVIVDEAHHVRNPRTRRYRAIAELAWGARVLLLTATPVHNRLGDLRAQLALFLGARAAHATRDWLTQCVVRRGDVAAGVTRRLPQVAPLRWLRLDPAPEVLRALATLPPAVPPADGGSADALLRLGLVRAWASSDGSLAAALRRRLLRASALAQSLEAGRLPSRRELRAWTLGDDAVQLAFPEFLAHHEVGRTTTALRIAVARHADGVRAALELLAQAGDRDGQRARHLRGLCLRHRDARIVAFAHYADTARALFRRLRTDAGVALVTGQQARIASGPVPRRDIIARFARPPSDPDDPRLPLRLLLATDALSEGLDLQGANVLVHLDLPWTVARLEQRLGRLRRLGSVHESITVYAMGVAATHREFSAVLRTLHRKAHLVESLVGLAQLPSHESLLGPRRPRGDRASDLPAMHEALRAELGHFIAGTEKAPAGIATSTERPLVAAVVSSHARRGWRALALVHTATRPRLLAVSRHGISEHPGMVLELVRVVSRGAPVHADDARARCSLLEAMGQVRAWLAHREADHLMSSALASRSRAHLAAFRQLDGVLSRSGRHQRPATAILVGRARRLVLSSQGAGAEHALERWIAAVHAGPGAGHASVADVRRLCDSLAERLSGTDATGTDATGTDATGTGRQRPAIHALLALVRGDT